MNRRNDIIVEWVINKIEKEYKDEVSLLLTYGSYENGTANELSDVDFYFIPKTELSFKLCKTFIVEGIGYDLFPMSWERVEGLAELNECITPCLGNVKVLYFNLEEDKARFEGLQNRLKENLNNKEFMLDKSSKTIEMAMEYYKNMLFEEDICKLRTLAGQVIMALADTVAYANQTYFTRGLKKQIEDLENMESIPDEFLLLYRAIMEADIQEEIKDYCYRIIKNTRIFLMYKGEKVVLKENKVNYQDIAELYQEIVSTWNKIYVCCDNGDNVLAYISGVSLQITLDMVAKENNFSNFDLMTAYNSKNLHQFKERAMKLQKEFVKIIEENGVSIESFNSVDEFIRKN